MSKLTLYKNTNIKPERNILIEDLSSYLEYNLTEEPTVINDYMFVRPVNNISLNLDNSLLNIKLNEGNYDYLKLEEDNMTFYYFVLDVKYVSEATVKVIASIDSVNTFSSKIYDETNKTWNSNFISSKTFIERQTCQDTKNLTFTSNSVSGEFNRFELGEGIGGDLIKTSDTILIPDYDYKLLYLTTSGGASKSTDVIRPVQPVITNVNYSNASRIWIDANNIEPGQCYFLNSLGEIKVLFKEGKALLKEEGVVVSSPKQVFVRKSTQGNIYVSYGSIDLELEDRRGFFNQKESKYSVDKFTFLGIMIESGKLFYERFPLGNNVQGIIDTDYDTAYEKANIKASFKCNVYQSMMPASRILECNTQYYATVNVQDDNFKFNNANKIIQKIIPIVGTPQYSNTLCYLSPFEFIGYVVEENIKYLESETTPTNFLNSSKTFTFNKADRAKKFMNCDEPLAKIYNSEFYQDKIVYDNTSYLYESEKVDKVNNNEVQCKVYTPLDMSSNLLINFDYNGNVNKVDQDFGNILITNRNTEEPLMTSDYYEYLTRGRQYDAAVLQLRQQQNYANYTRNMLGGAASMLGAGAYAQGQLGDRTSFSTRDAVDKYTESAKTYAGKTRRLNQTYSSSETSESVMPGMGPGFGAMAGAATVLTGASIGLSSQMNYETTNALITTTQAIKDDAKSRASASISSVDNYSLFKLYSEGNNLHRMVYKLDDHSNKAIRQIFHYSGYNVMEYGVPTCNKLRFDYVKCQVVFKNENDLKNIYQDYKDDLTLRFANGLTVIHKTDFKNIVDWDIECEKVNLDKTFISIYE